MHALQLDLLHLGTAKTESYRLKAVKSSGIWSHHLGERPAPYGEYRWVVESAETGRCIASRGFSPLFWEWTTTSEAERGGTKALYEVFRIPFPKIASRFLIQRRRVGNVFEDVFETSLSQISENLSKIIFPESLKEDVVEIMRNGSDINKLNILVLGDGYTTSEKKKFIEDSRTFKKLLFSVSPYKERMQDFNVLSLFTPSQESGITDPSKGIYRHTVFESSYNSLGIDRYLLPRNVRAVYEYSSRVPWDTQVILCNSDKFGGGGLYGKFSCFASRSKKIKYLAIHEFAHSFAGLADEYYTAPVTYESRTNSYMDPWEPNISRLDERGDVKWSSLIDASTPVPTPWGKKTYEGLMKKYEELREIALIENGDLSQEISRVAIEAKQYLENQAYFEKIGAFEGAQYKSRGLYRPGTTCVMFNRETDHFCQVCQNAISSTIDIAIRRKSVQSR